MVNYDGIVFLRITLGHFQGTSFRTVNWVTLILFFTIGLYGDIIKRCGPITESLSQWKIDEERDFQKNLYTDIGFGQKHAQGENSTAPKEKDRIHRVRRKEIRLFSSGNVAHTAFSLRARNFVN